MDIQFDGRLRALGEHVGIQRLDVSAPLHSEIGVVDDLCFGKEQRRQRGGVVSVEGSDESRDGRFDGLVRRVAGRLGRGGRVGGGVLRSRDSAHD